jgi:ribA/ribD-fused uncharacterized protein
MKQHNQTVRSKLDLVNAINLGLKPKYLFFWGHQPTKSGQINKCCYSQCFDAGFELEGIQYSSAEHYMMAEKARLFGDKQAAGKIVRSTHPGEAKILRREVCGFNEDLWLEHRFSIVVKANLAKI